MHHTVATDRQADQIAGRIAVLLQAVGAERAAELRGAGKVNREGLRGLRTVGRLALAGNDVADIDRHVHRRTGRDLPVGAEGQRPDRTGGAVILVGRPVDVGIDIPLTRYRRLAEIEGHGVVVAEGVVHRQGGRVVVGQRIRREGRG